MSYTIEKNIFKFVVENLSFEIADAHQSFLGTCFAAVAINISRTFARVLHDNWDIVVIYMKLIEYEGQVAR